jgi:D-alanyl-D-alanine carboxypeptidase
MARVTARGIVPAMQRVRLRQRRAVWLLAGLAVVAAALVVALTLPSHESRGRPELQRTLDGVIGRLAPGATAYVSGPRGTWVGSAGLSNVKTGERMRPDARMALDSVTKTWTATLVLQLVADGRLRLSDTVERWLPGLLPSGRRITVEQLLSHTSGLISGKDLMPDPVSALRRRVRDPAMRARMLRVLRRQQADPGLRGSPLIGVQLAAALPLRSAPGTTYHYSDVNYAIAGMIASKAGGAPLERLYRERIFAPLGLHSARYEPQAYRGPRPREYSVRPGGELVDATGWYRLGEGADSGMVSDAADVGRFLTALMRGRLLPPAELTAMLTPTAASAASYGLGIELVPTRCGAAYAHGGSSFASRTRVLVSRDGRRVAVLLLNGHVLLRNLTPDPRADDAVDAAAERLFCATKL